MNRLNAQLSAKEAFESHTQRIKTLDFALAAVYFSNLRRGTDERGLKIRDRVYLIGEYGYLPLTLSPLQSNFNERLPFEGTPTLQAYPVSQEEFIERERRIERTAAFVAMDVPSLEALLNNEAFDEYCLNCGMGIDRKHVTS